MRVIPEEAKKLAYELCQKPEYQEGGRWKGEPNYDAVAQVLKEKGYKVAPSTVRRIWHSYNKPKEFSCQRDENGRFVKGQCPNPGGKPKGSKQVLQLARQYTEEAILTLVDIMRNGKEPNRIAAAKALLDRGWGKPPQPLVGDENFEALKFEVHRYEHLSDEELDRLILEKLAAFAKTGATNFD